MKEVVIGCTKICGATMSEAIAGLDNIIAEREPCYVCFCDAHLNIQAIRSANVCDALGTAAYVFPDGISMTIGSRVLGEPLPQRLPGPVVMLEFLRHGIAKKYKHFLVGGEIGVADKLKEQLTAALPGLVIVGTNCPPFRMITESESVKFTREVHRAKPDVIWVALGAPKQELWMQRRYKELGAPLMLGVGAAFDFHSGTRKWAPHWIRSIGMEWLFRMFTGGKRVFFRNLKFEMAFVYYIIKQVIAKNWKTQSK